LRRLNTDYLDRCYLHVPEWQTPVEESLAAMDRLVRDGKVRYVGSSNYPSWQICRMLCVAEKQAYQRLRIAQQMYNLIARRLEDEFLPFANEFSVSTVVYNPCCRPRQSRPLHEKQCSLGACLCVSSLSEFRFAWTRA
jgi:aryl-alcohol dehydrogenase-like predicted oxidoreductase